MHSHVGSNYSPRRRRARPRLPGASSSTSVDSELPTSYTLTLVRPSATSFSQSYHACRRSSIPSPQLTRKRGTASSRTSWTTMKADPIDHLGPGDPETQTMAAVTDQGRQGGRGVHHYIYLLRPLHQHGRQDWDKEWQRSRVAVGRTQRARSRHRWHDY